MEKSENRIQEEGLILDDIGAVLIRLTYDPENWNYNQTHEIQVPKPDPDGSRSAMVPRDLRCRRYCAWIRAGLEEAWTRMDKFQKERFKRQNKHFNAAAKLVYGAFKRLSFQDLADDLKATSLRMYVIADLLEAEYLLRRKCEFESYFPPTTDRPMPQ